MPSSFNIIIPTPWYTLPIDQSRFKYSDITNCICFFLSSETVTNTILFPSNFVFTLIYYQGLCNPTKITFYAGNWQFSVTTFHVVLCYSCWHLRFWYLNLASQKILGYTERSTTKLGFVKTYVFIISVLYFSSKNFLYWNTRWGKFNTVESTPIYASELLRIL